MIISVDFDGTLCLGNKSHITLGKPNYILIQRLQEIKKNINATIKIVTARGSKSNLKLQEKIDKYKPLIEKFCNMYDIPYDEISFNKEYADLYIDDMTIGQNDNFIGYESLFTKNNLIFTDHTVIKKTKTSLFEKQWFDLAVHHFNVPNILFCNDETIITQRIEETEKISLNDCIKLLQQFSDLTIKNFEYYTYTHNILSHPYQSKKVDFVLDYINNHQLYPTFFHGDFTRENIIKNHDLLFLIDPNYKYVFGNYITDAAKLYFSIVAYEKNIKEANKLVDVFGKKIIIYAIAEGLRVCRYVPNYISIVNNIAEMI